MRKNKYVVANRKKRGTRKGRRHARRNPFLSGADLKRDVLQPVVGGTIGFVGARVLGNGLAQVKPITDLLDKDNPAGDNTKIAAEVIGILATLFLAPKVRLIRENRGALVTGMGLALVDQLIRRFGGGASAYLGEYVEQPLGEYVSVPLGEYVNQPMGEYVEQPLSGLGAMYAAAGLGDQLGIDRAMDAMEAAGGVEEAAAGLGQTQEGLSTFWAKRQPPFAITTTPTDVARQITNVQPYDLPVPTSGLTREATEMHQGLFAKHLFSGMMGA